MDMRPQCTVTFKKNSQERSIEFEKDVGKTLLELALCNNIEIDNSCGGNATCGTCRVFIEAGAQTLQSRQDLEQEMASDRGFSENERLSCQISPTADLIVRVP